ncbi:hypothetical protein GIB67_024601 [Kingdonia uniflora]|uniref:Aminotransferase-like plant mobile domain-containing protein n=1 Tax=Kingdonia uniflora TaxID=39325 RepID=A0A7J7LPE8_9MAGN|nr:hypothetical protein GIB67_024601 [Kingdonia uniflora]
MLTSLSIDRYPTQVPYDDAWSVLSNARQLLPKIDSSHIKSENVSILHLRMYLTVADDREHDITIARAFILFMMRHLWFQMANNTVLLGYLAAVANLDSAAQYDRGSAILASLYHGLDTAVTTGGAITGFFQLLTYCGVGHLIVKEDVKFSAYPRLRAWERGNWRKTNDQATNLFILGIYYIDHHTIDMITWEPWLESTVFEIEDALTVKLLSRKRMPIQVLNKSCEYYLGVDAGGSWLVGLLDCEQFVVGEERETYTSYWAEQTLKASHMLTDSQMMGNIDLFGPTALRAESARDAQRPHKLTDELVISHRQIDSIDHQLYTHDLQLKRGRDVRVVPLPPGGGATTRQSGSGP